VGQSGEGWSDERAQEVFTASGSHEEVLSVSFIGIAAIVREGDKTCEGVGRPFTFSRYRPHL